MNKKKRIKIVNKTPPSNKHSKKENKEYNTDPLLIFPLTQTPGEELFLRKYAFKCL